MRIGLYNPLSLRRAGRILHVATTLNCDALMLPGTGLPSAHQAHRVEPVGRNFWALHCGYGSSAFTNRSAGCTLIFKRRTFPQQAVQQISTMPRELQGRGISVRFKQKELDITFVHQVSFLRATCPAHMNFRLHASSTQSGTWKSRMTFSDSHVERRIQETQSSNECPFDCQTNFLLTRTLACNILTKKKFAGES